MLVQRRRRWANFEPTLGERLVFAGTRRCSDVESAPMTLIQRRTNVVRPVGNI